MVVEWISHLAGDFEIHVYSQHIEDLDLSKITWHRIPKLPGPHLINFLWWFAANHIWRGWHRRFRGLAHDLVFSPGINCLDADAVSVHIIFAEFRRRMESELKFTRNSVPSWPRLLHRRLYYRIVIFLERRVYTDMRTQLILTSPRSAEEIKRFYGRPGEFPIVTTGLDCTTFNPAHCVALRNHARECLGLAPDRFAVLLIGNDWRKKGLAVLLAALRELRDLPLDLLVAGRDDPAPFRALIRDSALDERVHFLPPRKDVEFYYAGADAYAGPSLEDTFALPAAEAMACGLPVIISARAGASELITKGVDGLILDDPTDAVALAAMIRLLCEDKNLRDQFGEKAAATAREYTWERSGRELATIFEEILGRKSNLGAQTLTQEL